MYERYSHTGDTKYKKSVIQKSTLKGGGGLKVWMQSVVFMSHTFRRQQKLTIIY
jgi:hypothetical protein